jgi:hypothetical protein
MTRSIAKHVAALQRPTLPMPPMPLTESEMVHYQEVLSGLPSQHHRSAVVRGLCAGVAQALVEIEQASTEIAARGLVVAAAQGPKPNPAVQIRDAATKRLAALASRLKALPSGDARENQRQAAFETGSRGVLPLPAANATGPAPDWAAMAKGLK